MKYYLVFVEDDIEPTIIGPFTSGEYRDEIALNLRDKHGDEHGIFPLDIDYLKGRPIISSYPSSFFREF